MTKHWPVQDAKAKFSELLREAKKEPQIITYRGEPKFEVRAKDDHTGKSVSHKGLPRWWSEAPKAAGFKIPPRKRERMRKIDL